MGETNKRDAWLRLGLFLLAFAIGWRAYRDAGIESLPWWWWPMELAAACGLLVVALRRNNPRVETPRRRTLRAVAAGVAVIAVGLAAFWGQQRGFEQRALIACLTAIAAFLAARWLPFDDAMIERIAPIVPIVPDAEATIFTGSPRNRLALTSASALAAIAAVACNVSTYYLPAFLFWLASLALFARAVWSRSAAPSSPAGDSWEHETGPRLPWQTEMVGLVAIVALALGLRTLLLADYPFGITIDEGSHGRTSEAFWKAGFPDVFGYTPWNAFPNLSFLIGYVGVQLFGPGYENLRLGSGVIGALTVIPLFFWARGWWGGVVALLAAALLAMNREHIYWSRFGINNIQTVMVASLMLATFARALRTRRPIDWMWLGCASGLAFHTYHASKVYPVLLACITLPLAIGIRGFVRQHRLNVLVAAYAFLLVLGPLIASTYSEWERFYASTGNRTDIGVLLSAFTDNDIDRARNHLHSHVVMCLMAFINHPRGLAIVEGAEVCVVFLLGMGWMWWYWRDPRHLVVVGWIAGILILGGMMTVDPPWTARMLGFLPAVCVVPAVVAGRLRGVLLRCLPNRRGELLVALLFVAWLGAAFYHNWYAEFVQRPQSARGDISRWLCGLLNRTPLPATFYAAGTADNGSLPDYNENICLLARSRERVFVNLANDSLIVPVRPNHVGHAVLVVYENQKELLPLVLHYYPGARRETVTNAEGRVIADFFTLSQEEVRQHQGLAVAFRSPERVWQVPAGLTEISAEEGDALPIEVSAAGQIWIAAPGVYSFRSAAPHLKIDGRTLANETPLAMAAGWHRLELQGALARAGERIELEWRKPDEAWSAVPRAFLHANPAMRGLLGRYFAHEVSVAGATPTAATPDYTQVEQALSFDWGPEMHETPPAPFAAKGATLEWSGSIDLPESRIHAIRLEATTGAQVFVDGQLRVSTEGSSSASPVEAVFSGVSGRVPILIRSIRPASDPFGHWRLRVLWQEPSGNWTAFAQYNPPAD